MKDDCGSLVQIFKSYDQPFYWECKTILYGDLSSQNFEFVLITTHELSNIQNDEPFTQCIKLAGAPTSVFGNLSADTLLFIPTILMDIRINKYINSAPLDNVELFFRTWILTFISSSAFKFASGEFERERTMGYLWTYVHRYPNCSRQSRSRLSACGGFKRLSFPPEAEKTAELN